MDTMDTMETMERQDQDASSPASINVNSPSDNRIAAGDYFEINIYLGKADRDAKQKDGPASREVRNDG